MYYTKQAIFSHVGDECFMVNAATPKKEDHSDHQVQEKNSRKSTGRMPLHIMYTAFKISMQTALLNKRLALHNEL